jgi:parvulin-like peptidyl-prolyl isomerase
MKKVRFAGLAAVLVAGAALGFASCANKKADGEVVARVNGTPIYASSLDMEVVRYEQTLLDHGEAAGSMDAVRMGRFRAGALEKLIDTELLYQEALRTGHEVADATVDEQMRGLSGQFENEEKFQEALDGLKIHREDLRRDLQHSLAIQQFINAEIEPKVSVTEQDARTYYDDNRGLFTQPERVRVREILLTVSQEGGEAAATKARDTLEELRRRAVAGEDFAALAKQYSQGPSASSGGDLGYFGRGDMVEPIERVAFALKVGEISGIVITPVGYHLIQLVDRTAPAVVPFEQIGPQLVSYLKDQRIGEALSDLTRDLRSKAEISIVAHDG